MCMRSSLAIFPLSPRHAVETFQNNSPPVREHGRLIYQISGVWLQKRGRKKKGGVSLSCSLGRLHAVRVDMKIEINLTKEPAH